MFCDSEKLPFDSWIDSAKVRSTANIFHRGILRLISVVRLVSSVSNRPVPSDRNSA
jgi:hypothetical protein